MHKSVTPRKYPFPMLTEINDNDDYDDDEGETVVKKQVLELKCYLTAVIK